jgi:hypothetical protein
MTDDAGRSVAPVPPGGITAGKNATLRMRPTFPAAMQYEDRDFETAVMRLRGTSPLALTARLATVLVTFGLLALAVRDGMSSPYLLLPFALEFVAMCWLGVWLCGRVNCPKYRGSWSHPDFAIAFGAGVLFALLVLIAYDAFRQGGSLPHWGLWSAVVATLLGISISTRQEVAAWRAEGGPFVWSLSVIEGLKMVVVLLMSTVGLLPILLVYSLVASSSRNDAFLAQGLWAWPVWALLLLVEIGVIVLLAVLPSRFGKNEPG